MRLKFFAIPVTGSELEEDDLNRFLATDRVLTVEKHLASPPGSSAVWAVCVSYVDGGSRESPTRKGKVDYKEVLDPQEFALFAELRVLRKELAERDGVPAYALFTNEQLAGMVQQRMTSKQQLEEIDGVGPARIRKYGDAFLRVLRKTRDDAASLEMNTEPSADAS